MSSSPGGSTAAKLLCPSCGYDLTGVTDAKCPECGKPFAIGLPGTRDGIALIAIRLLALLGVYDLLYRFGDVIHYAIVMIWTTGANPIFVREAIANGISALILGVAAAWLWFWAPAIARRVGRGALLPDVQLDKAELFKMSCVVLGLWAMLSSTPPIVETFVRWAGGSIPMRNGWEVNFSWAPAISPLAQFLFGLALVIGKTRLQRIISKLRGRRFADDSLLESKKS